MERVGLVQFDHDDHYSLLQSRYVVESWWTLCDLSEQLGRRDQRHVLQLPRGGIQRQTDPEFDLVQHHPDLVQGSEVHQHHSLCDDLHADSGDFTAESRLLDYSFRERPAGFCPCLQHGFRRRRRGITDAFPGLQIYHADCSREQRCVCDLRRVSCAWFAPDHHVSGEYFLHHHEFVLCDCRQHAFRCQNRRRCKAEKEMGGPLRPFE
mmetsp:Transcript_77542/g.128135  ORF Transcript_77542/g.128135 Transcript_77542/m.128135 type:complete len:208 (+) Transcript_77542:385-1008(+)